MSNSAGQKFLEWLSPFLLIALIFGTCTGIDTCKQYSTQKKVDDHLAKIDINSLKKRIANQHLKSQPVLTQLVPKGKTIAFKLGTDGKISLYYDVNLELKKVNLLAETLQECRTIYVQVDNEKYMGEFKYSESGRETFPTKVTHYWSADCFLDPESGKYIFKDEPPNTNPTSVLTKGGRPETFSGVLHSSEIAYDRIVQKIN